MRIIQNLRSLIGLGVISLFIIAVIAMIPTGFWYAVGVLVFGLFLIYCVLGFFDNGFNFSRTKKPEDNHGRQVANRAN